MAGDTLAQIARTVLYEGYLLWPYRRSAIKNRQRWTFGGVYPPAFAENSGGADRSAVRVDVLVELPEGDARIDVSLRFLHVVARQVVRVDAHGVRTPVAELTIGGERYLSWDEATERTVDASFELDCHQCLRIPVQIAAGRDEELLGSVDGRETGGIVRSWEQIDATITIDVSEMPTVENMLPSSLQTEGYRRVTITVANGSPWNKDAAARDDAIRTTLVSAHITLRSDRAAFVSTIEPMDVLQGATRLLRNEGLWPTLVGPTGDRSTMLATPIILGDYPRIAPESPGDLFDGGEIDQLLILNILTLTDAEQAEMRDSDPRAREILERCRALSPEELMRLHATVRPDRFDNSASRPFAPGELS